MRFVDLEEFDGIKSSVSVKEDELLLRCGSITCIDFRVVSCYGRCLLGLGVLCFLGLSWIR